MAKSIVVAHPGRQHSHQLAYALYKAGILNKYCTGLPARKGIFNLIPPFVWRTYEYYNLPFPLPYYSFHFLSGNLLRKIGFRVLNPIFFKHLDFSILKYFDYCISKYLDRMNATAIIAYENSALHSFRKAEELGMVKILDAASVHYSFQEQFFERPISFKLQKEINQRKEAEIQCADFIITTSTFAKETYLNAGVNPKKLYVLQLGVNSEIFKPKLRKFNENSCLSFLFCGNWNRHKGIDLLVEAYQMIRNLGLRCKLKIIGNNTDVFSEYNSLKNFKEDILQYGKLSQNEIASIMQDSECLVLPSRFDSFGMVVLESLSCGLPVIISNAVGAIDLVKENTNGWIIPSNDAESLANRMIWCIQNPKIMHQMREYTSRSVASFSWNNYHNRVTDLMNEISIK